MPMPDLQFHPYSQIFPLMTGDEYQELVDDIKANGLREPIMLFQDKILDGRNRYHACEKLGIDLDLDDPNHFRTFPGDDKAAESFVWSSNFVRRHLTSEQKRELIDKLLNAQPERSDRATAKLAKSDHKTVGARRSELEATGEIPQFDKRVGADRKTRRKETSRPKSSRRPKGSKPPAKEAAQFLPAELRNQTTGALCAALLRGDILDGLEDLHSVIADQKSRIVHIPLDKRVELAGNLLTAFGLVADSLRPVGNETEKQAA
jgi:hypothetical protein